METVLKRLFLMTCSFVRWPGKCGYRRQSRDSRNQNQLHSEVLETGGMAIAMAAMVRCQEAEDRSQRGT